MESYFIFISVIISIVSLVITIVMIYKFFRLCNAVDRIANAIAPEPRYSKEMLEFVKANQSQNSSTRIISVIIIAVIILLALLSIASYL